MHAIRDRYSLFATYERTLREYKVILSAVAAAAAAAHVFANIHVSYSYS